MPDCEAKTMLGKIQKEALFKWLKQNSKSKIFKFITSPVPWTARLKLVDGWRTYLTEREEIIDFIQVNNITGVVFISADVHFPILSAVRSDWLLEYSVSPLYSIPLEPYMSLEESEVIELPNNKLVTDDLLYVTSLFNSGYAYYFGNFKVHTTETDGFYEFSLYAYNQFFSTPTIIYSINKTLSDTIPDAVPIRVRAPTSIGKTEL